MAASSFWLCAALCLLSDPAVAKDVKRYSIGPGEVHYEIQGSGGVGSLMKTAFSGEKSLYFKGCGSLIVEETRKETTLSMGDEKITTIHTMKKTDQGKVYQVDCESKKITGMPDPVLSSYKNDRTGEEAEKGLIQFDGKKRF